MHYEVIVAGLGAMGSATVMELARRGRKVLGLDAHQPPHTLGSSHGRSRIIREAYFEHPIYVPLVQRALHLWKQLERDTGARIYQQTGGLMAGPADSGVYSGAVRSAQQHDIPHEILSSAEVNRRFPALRMPGGMMALLEQRAGLLNPERCVELMIGQARAHGADIEFNDRLNGWSHRGAGLSVTTEKGSATCDRLVLATGTWLPEIIGHVLPLEGERQLQFWFEPLGERSLHMPDRCPLALWEFDAGRMAATFPDQGDGVKILIHHEGASVTPDTVDRSTSAEEEEMMRSLLARFMPQAAGKVRSSAVCLYTNSPDGHFVVGNHPGDDRVLLLSPCSGHGFKFAPAIGELAAEMLGGEAPRFNPEPFSPARFAADPA